MLRTKGPPRVKARVGDCLLNEECDAEEYPEHMKPRQLAEMYNESRSRLGIYRKKEIQCGLWRVRMSGMLSRPAKESMAVYYVHPDDKELAETICEMFTPVDGGESVWNPHGVKHELSIEHKGDKRIVIFSDFDGAGGVQAAMNDCSLIEGEQVGLEPASKDQLHNLIVWVFPKTGRQGGSRPASSASFS